MSEGVSWLYISNIFGYILYKPNVFLVLERSHKLEILFRQLFLQERKY